MKWVPGFALGFLVALAFPGMAYAEQLAASMTFSPDPPLSLEPVTFTSTSTGASSVAWDLDNDGFFNDGTAQQVTLSFPSAAIYTVRLRAYGFGGAYGDIVQPVRVMNRAPTASIANFPATPEAGQTASFVALPDDADGTVVSEAWDLDGNGTFETPGSLVSHAFQAPGDYLVRLRVVDNDQASAVAAKMVHVDPKPPEYLSPFPLVRISGNVTVSGSRIKRLVVATPAGATAKVLCHGGGCKRRKQTKKAPARGGTRYLRFPQFEQRLRPHAVLEIFVTKPGTIGKYTRLTIRSGKRPLRRDLCIFPGAKHPTRCGA